ncbi:MAG: hypothetical protein WC956_01605 [bacterium]
MTTISFPPGMGASIQIDTEALDILAPNVAGYIDEEEVEGVRGLLEIHDIPEDLQPEATRELAMRHSRSASPTWRYDEARVEKVAEQLVRRTDVQINARDRLIARFNLLSEGKPEEAFNPFHLSMILPNLAQDDQRRAVRFMATVIAQNSDIELRRPAFKALEEHLEYLKPRDAFGVASTLMKVFEYNLAADQKEAARIMDEELPVRGEGDVSRKAMAIIERAGRLYSDDRPDLGKAMSRAARIVIERISPLLDEAEIMELARAAHKLSSRGGTIKERTRLTDKMARTLTAMASRLAEGDRPPWRDEKLDLSRIREVADKALSRSAGSPPAAGSAAFAEMAKRVSGAEFRQIGDSPYFHNGQALLRIDDDGRPTLFSPSYAWTDGLKIRGIVRVVEDHEEAFGILTREMQKWDDDKYGRELRVPQYHVRSLGDYSSQALAKISTLELVNSARTTPLRQQFVAAGFKEDPITPGIFRGGSDRRVIACVHDDTVWFLGRQWSDRYDRFGALFSPETQFRSERRSLFIRRGPLELCLSRSGRSEFNDGPRLIGHLEDVPPELLGVEEKEISDPETGFIYGGRNETQLIRALTSLKGEPIDRIEARMRPGGRYKNDGSPFTENFDRSQEGFLGNGESLLKVMAEDNDWVLSKGLTHRELEKALKYALWATHNLAPTDLDKEYSERMQQDPEFRKKYEFVGSGEMKSLRIFCAEHGLDELYREEFLGRFEWITSIVEFEFRGRHFISLPMATAGFQRSPINDGFAAGDCPVVVNIDNGKAINLTSMVAHLIHDYGIYEGHGTHYRVSPQQIVDVFDFLKP